MTTREQTRPKLFSVTTTDGVRIRGAKFMCATADTAIVLCHGFRSSWSIDPNVMLARTLARRFTVYSLDLRGHGTSGGVTTLGDLEMLDVHAVVSLARSDGFETVVSVGASMGGIAVLREAAYHADVDAVVPISAPAQWTGHGWPARISGLLVATRPGRALARLAFRTRIAPVWRWTPPPVDLIGKIDVPVLVVHGRGDRFIRPDNAELLASRGNERTQLHLLDGFGHAEGAYSPAFASWLGDRIADVVTHD